MLLKPPFAISARLLPSLKIDDLWVSYDPKDGQFFFDAPEIEYKTTSLRAGAASTIQSAFSALLSFMGAAAESVRFADGKDVWSDPDSNAQLFPREISEWCADHTDELSLLSLEISETPGLISAS